MLFVIDMVPTKAISDRLDSETCLPGGIPEAQIVTDEQPSARLLVAPD
jgi:hypothetical protein